MGKDKDLRKDIPVVQHEWSLEQLYKEYGLNPETGLTSSQVQQQREKFGSNVLTPPKITPEWLRFLNQFANFFAGILMLGSLLCFIAYALDTSDASNLYLGCVLAGVVFISSTFSYYQEAKSSKIMEGFKNMVPKKCKVLRDGHPNVVDAAELVPGDLVEIQEGDQVPADVRVVFAYNMKVDNSSLTGESEAQERFPDLQVEVHGSSAGRKVPAIEAQNLMFYSTILTSGHGKAVVIGTGDNTLMGQIAGLATGTDNQKTPIQMEVDRFIYMISVAAITIGIVFLSVGLALGINTVIQSLVFAISVIVATVPEGLLCTLTVALALTAKRMHHVNVLVKNLQSVETLGCTTIIASDKTGTLTQNRMTVQHCWYDNAIHCTPAAKNKPEFRRQMDGTGPHEAINIGTEAQSWRNFEPTNPTFGMLQKIATLCNNSDFILADKNDPDTPPIDLPKAMETESFNLLALDTTGDASESGLLKLVQILNDVRSTRQSRSKLFEIKFNSTNKWQLSIHDLKTDGFKSPVLLMKGAPERVWALCNKICINGNAVPIDAAWNQKFQTSYETLGSLGERVLGFAYKILDVPMDFPFVEKPERNFDMSGLTFAGLFSLMDPPKAGVTEAVSKCRQASVKVFMVTGDHPITAKAIGVQVGIIKEENLTNNTATVITGDDIRTWEDIQDDEKRLACWDDALKHREIVWARVSPAHKLLIVEHAQRHHHIVAVTGDGVNDAPALKKANIGVSMGISGKDVSKEAADMIILDDNFASIVNGVEQGRLIFDNLKKSVAYTLTSKVPQLLPFLIHIIIAVPLTISTILILVIDLGTDMVPSISVAYETPESSIMSRPPRNARKNHLVDAGLLSWSYLQLGVMQCLAGYFAFCVLLNDYGYKSSNLMFTGFTWDESPLICNGNGLKCGYGCASWGAQAYTTSQLVTLYPQQSSALSSLPSGICKNGCNIPTNTSTADPFIEFVPQGFRGFAAGVEAVCSRTCQWYASLSEETRSTYLAAAGDPSSPLRYILTPSDDFQFRSYCKESGSEFFGFDGRGQAGKSQEYQAQVGSMYWWQATTQNVPNMEYQNKILIYGQTAYFVAVVMTKVATVLMAKTRRRSLYKQGLLNNKFLMFAVVLELSLTVLVVYVPPFNSVFTTLPIGGLYWLPALPWMFAIFVYDELRKYFCRSDNSFGELIRDITDW